MPLESASREAPHFHEIVEFQLVLQGTVTYVCESGMRTLEPGDVFYAGWCVPHQVTACSPDARAVLLHLDLYWLLSNNLEHRSHYYRDLLTVHAENFDCFIRRDPELSNLLRQAAEAWHQRPMGWELQVRGLLYGILGRMLEAHYTPGPGLSAPADGTLGYTQEVLKYLLQNYNTAISLDAIAAQLGLTKSYVCRLFRQHTGCSITQYVNQLRCSHAIFLLQTDATVTQAAIQVGFSDYNYFSRVFRKTVGCSPTEFLKQDTGKSKNPAAVI